jgi:hypothetical protein
MADGGPAVFGVVAATVVFATLLAAGCRHLVSPRGRARALRLRGWPVGLSRVGSVLLAVTETSLGAAGLLGVALVGVHPAVGLAAALVFAAYAADAARILRSGAQAPCGCGAVDHPVTVWVVVRATAYACLAVVAALTGPAIGGLAPAAAGTAVVAAVAIGVPLWLLPRTLAIPAGFTLRP